MSLEFADIFGIGLLVPALLYGVVNVILGLAIFVQLRLETDTQTDGQTDRQSHNDS